MKILFSIEPPTKFSKNKILLKWVCWERGGAMLKFVSDCYKNQKMCNDTVDNYVYALQFVPNCYKTQKMCNKAVDTLASAIQLVPD